MENSKEVQEETKLGVWGNNTYGQVAVDSKSELQIFIPKMLSFEIDIRDISCGFQHTLFRSVDGEVFVTGDNQKCQLGIGKKIKRRISPTAIQLDDPNEKILLAQAQGYHSVIYTEYGNVYCWGDNTSGQLGTGDFDERDFPTNIAENLELKPNESIIQISLGREFSMALLNNGKIKAWGSNTNFQLGIEAESNQEVALPLECVIEDIKAIACGYEHTLFLDRNGDLYVCGQNSDGRLIATSDEKFIAEPTFVKTPDRVKKVFASTMSALITEKDDLYIWGEFLGEIIDMINPFESDEFMDNMSNAKNEQGYSNMSSKNPANRSQIKVRVETVGIGFDFLVAADDYGECYSWGNNDQGQLGQIVDENSSRQSPYEQFPKKLQLFRPFDVKSVHIGYDFAILLLSDKANENYEGTSVDYIPYKTDGEQEEYIENVNEEDDEYEDQQRGGLGNNGGDNYYENQEEEEEESEYDENQRNLNDMPDYIKKMPINKDDPLFHIFRLIVYLYEDLRYKLIKIIDENVEVEKVLSEDVVDLIKRQQDIIDEYLRVFDLKKNIDIEITGRNIDKFQVDSNNPMVKKNFGVSKDMIKKAQKNLTEVHSNTFNKQKILQKLKVEREIVEQRLKELKEFIS